MAEKLNIINLEELLGNDLGISKNKNDLDPGALFIKNIERSVARNGREFIKGSLTDGSTDVSFKIWDYKGDGSEFNNSIKIKEARLDEYMGNIQLIIDDYEFIEMDLESVPMRFNLEYIKEKTKELIKQVKDPLYRELLNHFIIDNDKYWISPAAVSHHHSYLGGLCQHSYEVGTVAYMNAKIMEKTELADINIDLVITGGLLHDIGKTKVYDIEGLTPIYDEFYGLYEHLVEGVLMVREYLLNNNKYYGNEEKIALLDHIILSHHLKKEYGSPVNPQFKEAYIVNAADTFSSQYNALEEASKFRKNGKNPKKLVQVEGATIFTNDFIKEVMDKFEEENSFGSSLEENEELRKIYANEVNKIHKGVKNG